MSQANYFIGLMSGTSADGVDAALINTSDNKIELIDFVTTDLPKTLKIALLKLNQDPNIHLKEFCLLNKQVADSFIQATHCLLNSQKIHIENIRAIGSHGQTIYHAPDIPMTLQIGHPAFIAKQTGITTVADFRVDDMALGGQGAPFAPAFHNALFAEQQASFVVNIGGIANISYLPETGSDSAVTGWDTGPGNALMDEVCEKELGISYDPNGTHAKKGHIHNSLLQKLLSHPYFLANHPKSTGRDTFHMNWIGSVIQQLGIEISTQDLLATLCELTTHTIAEQIKSIDPIASKIDLIPVWIVGGGAYNGYLIERLQSHLPNHSVASSQDRGINPNAVEAMMCAWLAEQRINNKTIELSAVTGAERNAVLGGIWHP